MAMVIAGLFVLVLIAGGIYMLASNGDDEDTSSSSTTQTTQQIEPSNENDASPSQMQAESNIVELAQATDDLSILVDAVVAADLVGTLSGDGPFTVFAPTNDAFATLLEELDVTAEQLLARDDLGAILTYHVVSGEVMAADLSDGQIVETVQGGTLTVSISDAGVTLTDANGNVANVTATDIDASNGVVHLIDAVVLP